MADSKHTPPKPTYEELRQMLENIVGLAEVSGGNLHHYGAAVREALDLLERAR